MTGAVIVLAWILAGWTAIGVLAMPFAIGKPREPLAPGVALVSMIVGGLIVTLLVALAVTL